MNIDNCQALWTGMMDLTDAVGDWAWMYDAEYDGWFIGYWHEGQQERLFVDEADLLDPQACRKYQIMLTGAA